MLCETLNFFFDKAACDFSQLIYSSHLRFIFLPFIADFLIALTLSSPESLFMQAQYTSLDSSEFIPIYQLSKVRSSMDKLGTFEN